MGYLISSVAFWLLARPKRPKQDNSFLSYWLISTLVTGLGYHIIKHPRPPVLSGIRWGAFPNSQTLWKVSTLKRDGWGVGDAEPGPQAPIGQAGCPGHPVTCSIPGPRGTEEVEWNERFCWKQQPSPPRLEGWGGEEAGPSMKSLWRLCCSLGGAAAEQFPAAFPCLVICPRSRRRLGGFPCPFPHPSPAFLATEAKEGYVGSSSQWAQAEKKDREGPLPGIGPAAPQPRPPSGSL